MSNGRASQDQERITSSRKGRGRRSSLHLYKFEEVLGPDLNQLSKQATKNTHPSFSCNIVED